MAARLLDINPQLILEVRKVGSSGNFAVSPSGGCAHSQGPAVV